MILALVGGGNDDADGFLVEALEPAVALEVLEVAAECAFPDELLSLLTRNQPVGEQALGALAAHGPALAFGEGLAQEREIGEGAHCVHAGLLELGAQEIEVEP